ncbi:MAG: hypothetical protein K9J13_15405 [Saprospiraceae bacterium]|nr:hypothetical protein [Saprospiraceae bacterium]
MNIIALKSNLHKLIDQIESQSLLEEYYSEMKSLIKKTQISSWDSLTEEQKKEVLLSYEESENDNNLVDNDTVMNKYKDLL